ncbi:imidazole glycerol phosphate synthase subunit HisF [Magnetococcus sp. PR-3]|uniref:imidazole glycerol phosphate synthase subunit HisF n=1 Tax=Magnetococcus sp. PR-3 TaxID=3120355 RepID=UPI002FCE2B42
MLKHRLIAVLILRHGQVVQSIKFRHTNVIHAEAMHAVEAFSKWSVDEIVMLNVTKEPDSQARFAEVVAEISEHCFVPLAAGGWVTNMDYAQSLLRNGADKLVVNSILHNQPELVQQLSAKYGRQCIVGSMDVKRNDEGLATVRVDRGTVDTGKDAVSWTKHAETLGVGELFVNSIDHDGNRKGYDLETIEQVSGATQMPVIAFGGVFRWDHLVAGLNAGADACAAANILHYTEQSTRRAKAHLARSGIAVRQEGRWLV